MLRMFFARIFFFQAEDGIRDSSVTGVQTCALPLLIAFGYVAVAGLMNVNLTFAAFLAGFAVSRKHLGAALETITRFSFALFIPLYFALVGYNLVFGKSFSLPMLFGFLAGACLLKLASV